MSKAKPKPRPKVVRYSTSAGEVLQIDKTIVAIFSRRDYPNNFLRYADSAEWKLNRLMRHIPAPSRGGKIAWHS